MVQSGGVPLNPGAHKVGSVFATHCNPFHTCPSKHCEVEDAVFTVKIWLPVHCMVVGATTVADDVAHAGGVTVVSTEVQIAFEHPLHEPNAIGVSPV